MIFLRRYSGRYFKSLSFLVVLFPAACWSATVHVGTGQAYTSIQSGIVAASNGDTILVEPGTYYENIDFIGKSITVTSVSGAAVTILDGQYKGPAVQFVHGETRGSVLSGLTVRNGGNFESVSGGQPIEATGGIYVEGSAPTILNNILMGNRCWSIDIEESAPLVQGNNISATRDPNGLCSFGGGSAMFVGLDMLGPSGNYDQPALIIANTIENNVESGFESAAGGGGAAIAVWGGGPLIENNILRNNASPGGTGGAILIESGAGIAIVQNLIYGNSAGCGGGGLAINSGYQGALFDALVVNNTIVNNDDSLTGQGSNCEAISQFYPSPSSYGESDPGVVFVNNIFSGSAINPAVNCSVYDTPSEEIQPLFDHNLFFNASGTVFGSSCIDVSSKYGNIVADPQFVDPRNNNYRLKAASPAVDAGLVSALQSVTNLTSTVLSKDLDGNARVQDATGKGSPAVDLGAYELVGVVDGSATSIVLTSSAYSGAPGNGYTLTAMLTSALGIPGGAVTLFLDGQTVSTMAADSSGKAVWPNLSLTPGFHTLYAGYAGQGAFPQATSVNIAVVVDAYDTQLKIVSSANPSVVGQAVTFTVTSSSSAPGYSPTPVTLTDASTGMALATLTFGSSNTETYTTSSLTLGLHTIQATFAGTVAYSPASASVGQVVTAGKSTSTTLSSSQNPSVLGQMIILTSEVKAANVRDGVATGSVVFTDGGQVLTTVSLDATGTAIYITSSLAAGMHSLTATYQPSGGFAGSSGSLSQQVSNGYATGVQLTAMPNPSVYGQSVTFTIGVTATGVNSVPSGTVSVSDGAATLTSERLSLQGTASYVTSNLSVGSHMITVVFVPDTGFNGSSAQMVQIVTALDSTAQLNVTPAATGYGDAVSLRVLVSSGSGPITPTGTITFLDGNVPIGSMTLVNGVATLTTSTLSVGNHTLSCTYTGDLIYKSTTCGVIGLPVSAVVSQLTLTSAQNPSYALASTAFTAKLTVAGHAASTGTVVTLVSIPSGATVSAVTDAAGNANFIEAFDAGTYTLMASVVGSATTQLASATLTQVVQANPVAIKLSSSMNPVAPGQPVTLSVLVSSLGAISAPIGTVTIMDGSIAVGVATITKTSLGTSSGIVELSALSVGTHTLSAVYSPGSADFTAASSAVLFQTIVLSDFAIQMNSGTVTVETSRHISFPVTIASIGAFEGLVKLSCTTTSAPYLSCELPTSALLAKNGIATFSVVINTDQIPIWAQNVEQRQAQKLTLGTLVAFAFLPLLRFRKRKSSQRLCLGLILALASTLTACGAGNYYYPGHTPPGTYLITVQGDSVASQQHAIAITLVVTP